MTINILFNLSQLIILKLFYHLIIIKNKEKIFCDQLESIKIIIRYHPNILNYYYNKLCTQICV